MADNKQNTTYYQLGGINQKSSKYEFPATECLSLYNLDFDVPNAWQKRPGSTLTISNVSGLSGPVIALAEYQQLLSATGGQTATHFLIAASNTALYFNTPDSITNPLAYSLLSPGWTNGQPPDMLTFVNDMWACNGQVFGRFDGTSFLPAGLPIQKTMPVDFQDAAVGGASYFCIGGQTMISNASAAAAQTDTAVGVYLAYSYVRSDGYQGPGTFIQTARNLVNLYRPSTSGSEMFNPAFSPQYLEGFTSVPNSPTINLWLATDYVTASSPTLMVSPGGVGSTLPANTYPAGNLGYMVPGINGRYMSATLYPGADLTRFHFFTSIPSASLFPFFDSSRGQTFWSCTFIPGPSFFNSFNGVATADGFSGMSFDFYSTYTPKYIEVDQNIMFMSGFSSAPSTLWYSEVGEPETILPESNFEVRTNDGDRIYAQKTFLNQLVVMKENSFHTVLGSDSDNFQLVQISSEYGCISDRTVLQVKQALYWLDKKGILEFNGASFNIISTPVEGIFKRMNIPAAKDNACAVHHKYRNQIWFGIPIDGSTVNNVTVVYDYLVGSWTFFDGFQPSSLAFMRGSLTNQTAWRGDYSGFISYFNESLYSDNGQAISCVALTRFENVGGENQTTLWRRFFLDVATATGVTTPINCQFFANYDQTTIQATFSLYQNQFQTRAEFGVNGKSFAGLFSHCSASLPLLINGYAFANRPLRNV
jgi:hypothetical protein